MGNKIGKQQLQTSQSINELIKNANNKASCGPDCEKKKKISGLKSDYDNAASDLSKGPENLTEARKNYFVYAFGNKYNNNFNEKLYTKEASEKVKKLITQHSENVKEISTLLNDYDSAYVYKSNMGDLSQKYEEENKTLKGEIDHNIKEVATNDRKVFYENQQIENIKYYRYLIKLVYWVILVLYTVVFLYDGYYKKIKMDVMLVSLYIYPYVIDLIIGKILYVFGVLKEYIPNNVYLNASSM